MCVCGPRPLRSYFDRLSTSGPGPDIDLGVLDVGLRIGFRIEGECGER